MRSEWRQAAVIREVHERVTRGMEDAAKLVEITARHNMLRIKDPEFGIKYRKYLALYRLTSLVRGDVNTVVAYVGMPPGRKGSDYGYWIEIGSRTAPAHPWLRPALLHNLQTIMDLLGG